MDRMVFPFAAVIGQDAVKKALIWNIVNPNIGGVLISGEKGTAKSTLVRGLCCLLPDIQLVEIPLNTTEDRLCGSIDFEHAVKYGKKRFEMGILQKAHGNLLYVDEVNLLSDHLVKILLESAASGMNIVEREGISCQHPSKFILVGSMNPEEGGLRPQFLDRFGLYVEVVGEKELRKRAEIVKRWIEYERAPLAFIEKWRQESERLIQGMKRARNALTKVTVTSSAMQLAASMAREGNCSGHRGELVIIETAKAIAALEGRVVLNISDIKEAAKYALPHRVRENQDQERLPKAQREQEEVEDREEDNRQGNGPQNSSPHDDFGDIPQNDNGDKATPGQIPDNQGAHHEGRMLGGSSENLDAPGETFLVSRWLSENINRTVIKGSGKRSRVKTSSMQGRYIRYRYPERGDIRDIAIAPTLRGAAPYQLHREKEGVSIAINKSDIRVKVREKRTGNTILFVVDASSSMGANKRMRAVKGAILSLLNDAYQKRDKVGMIAFKNDSAEIILSITRSVELAKKKLTALPTSGRTPLAAGLNLAYEVIKAAKIKDKDTLPVIVLVSDGRATYSSSGGNAFTEALASARRIAREGIKSIVIDTDRNFVKLHLAEKIAEAMKADLFAIEDLQAQSIAVAVTMSL